MPDELQFMRLTIARDEMEAELICGLLRDLAIPCMHRITDFGFGSGGEVVASGMGLCEVLIHARDAERARAAIEPQN